LAAELARRPVSIIFASVGIVATRAATAASTTIPIVFVMGGDPVKLGVVASLNRPGGKVTGVSFQLNVLAAKRIGLLRDLVPAATTIGLLVNPDNPNAEADASNAEAAVRALGQHTHVVRVRTERDFDAAFASLVQHRAAALFVASDPLFVSLRDRLVALAASHALPAIYDRRELAAAGGLISYGTNFADAHRQAGVYAGRILNGAAPADLPVMQATKFELVINLKSATALGIAIPPTLLALADEVIE
jgi:putative ABC transport system substrate-binding protein